MSNSTKASQGKLRRNAPEHRVKYFESYFFPIQKEVRRQLDFTNDSWLLDAPLTQSIKVIYRFRITEFLNHPQTIHWNFLSLKNFSSFNHYIQIPLLIKKNN